MRNIEVAAVQHQIAGDLAHAVGAQVAHHQPELLQVQLRIAATLEVEVAIEGAILELAISVELGLPLIGRTEHFQRGVGGEQLHGRCRVHRDVGVEIGSVTRAFQGNHHQRQGIVCEFAGPQRFLYAFGQGAIDLGNGWQGEGQ